MDVTVSFSNGKFNGTIDVVAPVSTQMLVSMPSSSSSSSRAKRLEVEVGTEEVSLAMVARRWWSTRLVLIKVLHEAVGKILHKLVLVVTVALFIVVLSPTGLQTSQVILHGGHPGPV